MKTRPENTLTALVLVAILSLTLAPASLAFGNVTVGATRRPTS